MNRRSFNARLGAASGFSLAGVASLATSTALFQASAAHAQAAFTEGREFRRLPAPVAGSTDKIEVIEFFWYGCGSCDGFEPALNTWARKLPSDVQLRKLHVDFRPAMRVHQQLFYALQALGREDALRSAVFDGIHRQAQPLSDLASMQAFLGRLGVDAAAFRAAFESAAVSSQMQRATQLQTAYKLEGVPSLTIAGRYLTSPSLATGGVRSSELAANLQALKVADFLIQRVRQAR